MQFARTVLALLTLSFFSACEAPPEFIATLSDQGDTEYDPRVLGQWYQRIDDGGTLLAAISDAGSAVVSDRRTPAESGSLLQVILTVQGTRENDAVSLPFTAFASLVDDTPYYNVTHAQSPYSWDVTVPDQAPSHYIMRAFPLTPDTMLVCILTEFTDADQKASGLTQREVEQPIKLNGSPLLNGDDWQHKFVDGSREDLRQFVGKDNASRFTPAFYLARVGTAWLDPVEDPQQWARINKYREQCNVDELRKP